MFRNGPRPPTPTLDEVTAERLLRSAPVDDVPMAYRSLGQLLADAAGPARREELEGSAAAAAAFVAAHHVANAPRPKTRSMAVSVLTVFAVAASTGTAVAAAHGALPEPIQQVAHQALGAVAISVPGIEDHETHDGGDGGVHPAPSVSNDKGASVAPSARASATPTRAVPPAAPAGGSTGPAAADPATSDGNTSHDGGDNPTTGVGVDTPTAGSGDTSGIGDGNARQGESGGGAEEPPVTMPSPSDGNGNGQPHTRPGQARNPS